MATINGTFNSLIAGSISGQVGTPGPAGPVGPAGPAGAPGPGLPVGGLVGQIIVKASETDYDTVWVDNAAETLTATVRNETGATLTKGTVVYINGASGNKATVTKASASSEAASSKTFAILSADILDNQNGQAVTVGLLKGLNTLAFSPGANLWLSTTAGEITQTPPVSPNHAVFLGNATRIHATQGEIEVRIQNGLELGELHDVLLTSPTEGQVLKYDATSGLWKNGTDVGGVAWGGITGDLSNQGDLVTALGLKYDASNPLGFITSSALTGYATQSFVTSQGYITSSALTGYATESFVTSQGYITSAALSPYLTSATAASTYQTLSGMSSYLTTSAAASTYLTQANAASTYYLQTNPAGYITSAALSPYLLSSTAASTYQTIAGMSSYLTTSAAASTYYPLTNPSGYITSSALSGYATESWVTAGFYPLSSNPAGYLTSASLSGYATESWVTSQLGSYLTTSAAASTYLTQSNAASTYQTISGMSSYLTTATAASTYAPLASPALTGNPTAPTPATADNDTSIATTAFVKAQGYLTSAPVTSVAGKTGAVTLVVGDVSGAAPLASPTFTGTPAAPTATAGTNTTQIATTAFVTAGLNLKANLASPTFTGTPAAPTASAGTSTTQLATTAFVTTADNLKANLASPAFTGTPTAPTATAGTNTTQIATTAFVTAAVPAFATTAEINSPSATNKVVSPYDVVRMVTNPALFDTQASSPVFATSGAGAEAYKQSSDRQLGIGTPNVGVAGYGQVIYETTTGSWGVLGAKRGATMQTQNFNKRIWMAGTTCFLNMGDANTTGRLMLGGRSSATTGSPTKQSIGWRVNGGGGNPLVLVTYGWNGSALVVTETTSSFTPVANQTFDWMIYHEPNVANPATSYCYLFVNDSLVATGIYSPADATVSANYYVQTCEATASQATRMNAFILPTKIWWSK